MENVDEEEKKSDHNLTQQAMIISALQKELNMNTSNENATVTSNYSASGVSSSVNGSKSVIGSSKSLNSSVKGSANNNRVKHSESQNQVNFDDQSSNASEKSRRMGGAASCFSSINNIQPAVSSEDMEPMVVK